MKGLKRPANQLKLLQQESAHGLVIIEDPHLPRSASRTKFLGRSLLQRDLLHRGGTI
jgi:hypothetical protein